MATSPDVRDARTSLRDAETAGRRLAGRGRWASRYFAVFAVATLALVPLTGLAGTAAVVPVTIGWVALVSGLVVWAQHQGVVGKGSWRLHAVAWGAWALLWATTVVVGSTAYPGTAAFWVPAAVVVAAPMVVAAAVAARPAPRS